MKIYWLILMMSVGMTSIATASPTASDFERCQLIAVATLKACFQHREYSDKDECWSQSKDNHDRCVQEVIYSYDNRQSEKEAAAKRKAQEAAKRKAQQAGY